MSEETQISYKDTLNLPKTDFQMKGNLNQREPEFIKEWDSKNIYQKMVDQNSEKGTFTFIDGPPYANGSIHIGHALNKTLKDIVVKYKNMSGYRAPFVPGWDCHGLPIELVVTKNLGDKKAEKSEAEIRELCRQEAKKWVGIQMEEFKRFGVLADWANPYLTLNPAYEAEEIRVLARILKTGAFYYGVKPVYWSWALRTALAEAEVEYKDVKSPSIYVRFELKEGIKSLSGKKQYAVIWTTTPWTLPANLAICVHPEFTYEAFEWNDCYLIIAQDMKAKFEADSGLTLKPTGKVFSGEDLEGLAYTHPMSDYYKTLKTFDSQNIHKIILGNHVTLEAGTGLVHTAPGHGPDDYNVGLKYNLPIFSPVDETGAYTQEVPEYKGQNVLQANAAIVERLKTSGYIIAHKEYEHSYPHCWRSKKPLIFRATPQWFLKMDLEKDGSTVRKRALDGIKKVNWYPAWGENRISSMIENRPDWCVSRQRTWGVPIPVLYCSKCSTPLAKEDIMLRIADEMENNGGMEGYYNADVKKLLGTHKCECGSTDFVKGKDILDVWFDSGVAFSAVRKQHPTLQQPADFYLEGSDQHRGWFHTSLLASVASEGIPPFKSVLTHGFVLYAKGQKMSKSQGNTIAPQDIIKNSGSDILRMWAAHEDYTQDISCNPEGFARITETYRRLRNTIRFLLGNIHDFDPAKDKVAYTQMTPLDQWALARLNQVIKNVEDAYEKYEFYKIYHLLNNFVTVDLSAFYLDILKDRLYVRKKDGVMRRSSQTALYEITSSLARMMAPIMSFLAEETYQFLVGSKKESIFLEKYPQANKEWENSEVLSTFESFIGIRTEALKKLEELRQNKTIGASLEAQLHITAQPEQLKVLDLLKDYLNEFFIVSQVSVNKTPGELNVTATKANGEKCVRCWTYNVETNKNPKFPGICPKCVEALS